MLRPGALIVEHVAPHGLAIHNHGVDKTIGDAQRIICSPRLLRRREAR